MPTGDTLYLARNGQRDEAAGEKAEVFREAEQRAEQMKLRVREGSDRTAEPGGT